MNIQVAIGLAVIVAWWAGLVIGYIREQQREAEESHRKMMNDRDWREIAKEVGYVGNERQQGKVLEEDENSASEQ